MESLLNKVILITGASTGIGGCTARYLAKFKPKLVLVARSPDRLKHVQQLCEEGGCEKGNVVTVTADLAKLEDLSGVISEAITAFGQLDVLVNNAAAFVLNDVETTSPEFFDRTMAVNIRAPFFLAQAAMPYLKKTKGCIINISSINAHRGVPHMSAYGISKAALEQFTRVLALELAPSGVRVNAIRVGVVLTDTQMEVAEIAGVVQSDMTSDIMDKIQPLGGEVTMEDIAKVVAFLSSDLSAAMTGTYLTVDRGSELVSPVSDLPVLAARKNTGYVNAKATQDNIAEFAAKVRGTE